MYKKIYKSLIGYLEIVSDRETITNINFIDKSTDLKENSIDVIENCIKQLDEYFNGKRKVFNLKLNPQGTEFQKLVWNALLKIPYGETKSYKEIAVMIGNKKASRAVGNANNKNPIPIIIPCHRVIGSNKELVGYAGGLDIKRALLDIEENSLKG